MDFEAFAEEFRQRTANRLVEFEKALDKTQAAVLRESVDKKSAPPPRRAPATSRRVQSILRKS